MKAPVTWLKRRTLLVARLPTRRSVRAGTVTTSGLAVAVLPSAFVEYRVDTPVRWSETQNGPVWL